MERDDNSMQKAMQDDEQEFEESWHEYNRKLLNEIGMITHGIKVEGVEHRKKMAQLGINEGFERIFTGDRNG